MDINPTIAPYFVVAYVNVEAINTNTQKTNQPEFLSNNNFLLKKLPSDFL
jgi:hypothetical protein